MSSYEPNLHPQSTHCLDDASYVLGSLSPAERQVFEQHLATCPTCQASVAKLAGLPGLLALTSAAELGEERPPVPETLLPRLLAVASRERRRRRLIWSGTIAAAAACVAALVITIAARPAAPRADPPLPAAIQMQHVVPGPMNVSLQLIDKQWGTSIIVNCHYSGTHDSGDWYRLVVFDKSGTAGLAGSWKSVTGSGSTVPAASWVKLSQISRIEVQLPNGQPVLTAVPQHN